MSKHQATTVKDRQSLVEQHQRGVSYAALSQASGWAVETIGKYCRAYQQDGQSALQPQKRGPASQGLLSTFEPVVRFAALRLKRQHPDWGPAVIIDELGQRRSTRRKHLPHASQLAAYFGQFGVRLIRPRRHLQLPVAVSPVSLARQALVFQLDMQERLRLPQLGYFNVLNLRAPEWGLTVGCYPHRAGLKRWARKVSLTEARDDCRTTFEQWGLPDAIQTDHDKVLVATGEYPFPSLFTLWLVGLDIQHSLIQRVTQNACVERSHRTFDKQMLSGCAETEWPAFLRYVQKEVIRLNERVPSRANACQGKIPIEAHPEARHPQRPYRRQHEEQLFSLDRVYRYLAQGRWLRQASTHGQFSFADYVWTAGQAFEHQSVVITFTADTQDFVISTLDNTEIKRMSSTWLNEATIRGIP